jgi:hypothetical protein
MQLIKWWAENSKTAQFIEMELTKSIMIRIKMVQPKRDPQSN